MPAWVQQGYADYAKRLPRELGLYLTEIPLAIRSKTTPPDTATQKEGEKILAAIPTDNFVIALDVGGNSVSTQHCAIQMADWRQARHNISFLIGGPDGLASACIKRADAKWSLSAMTFPHALVRIMLIEQLYRAWTILHNHPYHK